MAKFKMAVAAAASAALISSLAYAQSSRQNDEQSYAAMQDRTVKALSDQQIADLRAGAGMGLALPAELNGYPGPRHVLEHADELGLSPEQRERTKLLQARMRAEAVRLGEVLIRQEGDLDRLFASRAVSPASLESATTAIGSTQARLRAAHLRTHISMMDVLTPGQVRRYAELRGYGPGTPASREQQDHSHHGGREHH